MRELESRYRIGVDSDLAKKIVDDLGMFVRQFPKPTDPVAYTKLVDQWEKSLNMSDSKYHPSIYEEAVSSWLSAATSKTFPPYPGDILEHCEKVMDRIARDPVRGPKMEEWQEERRMARSALIVWEDQ